MTAAPHLSGHRSWLQVVRRAMAVVRAQLVLGGCALGPHVAATGSLVVDVRGGRVRIGRRTTFEGGIVRTELSCRPRARLEIGERCVVNYGAAIRAAESVEIGARTLIASFVVIADAPGAPIVIGDDVWIAHGAVIGPGVTLGSGSTVAAKSVVTRDVPPGSLAIGNPARALALGLVTRPTAS